MDLDLKTLQYLLQQTLDLRGVCLEHMYFEFKNNNSTCGLANIDRLAENLIELNKAIKFYKGKILELTTRESK